MDLSQKYLESKIKIIVNFIIAYLVLFLIAMPYPYMCFVIQGNIPFHEILELISFLSVIILFILSFLAGRKENSGFMLGVMTYPIFSSIYYVKAKGSGLIESLNIESVFVKSLMYNLWYSGTVTYTSIMRWFCISFTLTLLIYLSSKAYYQVKRGELQNKDIFSAKYILTRMGVLLASFLVLLLINIIFVFAYMSH